MSLSVVILSKTASNLRPCVAAVRANEPDAKITIVDDGVDLGGDYSIPYYSADAWVPGIKPFLYARNVNRGIYASGRDDIVLLNDDAILKTPRGFSLMQEKCPQDYGIVASTCNNVGNRNQWPHAAWHLGNLRPEPRMVCFVCVYIPRRTIDQVGLLDERFVGYGFEDDDYCLRIRKAGLKIGIFDGCYVDHGSLKSTFRGDPKTPANLTQNQKIFVQKWGAHPL